MNITPLIKTQNDAPLNVNTSEQPVASSEASVGQAQIPRNGRGFASLLDDNLNLDQRKSSNHKRVADNLPQETSLVKATENDKQDESKTEVREEVRESKERTEKHQPNVEQILELSDEEDELHAEVVNSSGQEFERGRFCLLETPTVEQASQTNDSSRLILHIADLERIVASVRTQTMPQGRQEVTLELTRSVLEGLRIKLNCDKRTGRISAELIASSESVKAQLDVRTSELGDLLRSRGINLTNLKTSLSRGGDALSREGADSDAQQRQRQFHESAVHLRRSLLAIRRSSTSSTDADLLDEANGEASTTYRA